jgi:hypothetical protein
MNGTQSSGHGHHKIAAALFVGSLIIGCAMILSAELTKPVRYEYHAAATANPGDYMIFDTDTGRLTTATIGSENPLAPLEKAEKK